MNRMRSIGFIIQSLISLRIELRIGVGWAMIIRVIE